MRPRAIQGVPGLDPSASPFKRLEQFARIVVQVPKTEADENMEKATVREAADCPQEEGKVRLLWTKRLHCRRDC